MSDEMKRELQGLKNGMAEVGRRLDAMSSRSDTLSSRVDALSSQVGTLSSRVDTLSSQMDTLSSRMDKNEATLGRVVLEVSGLKGEVSDMRASMSVLATKDDVGRIIGHIVAFSSDVEAARRDRALSSDAYMRHQRELEDHEARLQRLEKSRRRPVV